MGVAACGEVAVDAGAETDASNPPAADGTRSNGGALPVLGPGVAGEADIVRG